MDDFELMHVLLEMDESKIEAMRNGGGEVLEDTGDDCESGACKI